MMLIREAFARTTKKDKFQEACYDDLEMFIYQCSKAAT